LIALAYETQGDIPAALGPLGRALSLAEPEGYVRIFVAEGAPMARLLNEPGVRQVMPLYVARLLAAIAAGLPEPSQSPAKPSQAVDDSLSEREREVLTLIAEGLSNQEIGDRLYLALDTVKGHNRRLFAKLGVQRRTEAISRARDLGLL
jgi:LuxR family transcriptional regulator, maltose regulon positive regulatory protein